MTRNEGPVTGLTRRNFLKTTGAAAGLAGLGATGMLSADAWFAPTEAHAEPEERISYAFHQYHCGGHCSLKCTVRDGRLCMIEPNDGWEDKSFQKCCLKGLSEVQHVYSAERIQSPMKRVGGRESQELVAITWDEAFQILKEELEAVWDKYGREAVFVHSSTEATQNLPFFAAILGAQTGGRGGIDMGLGNGFDESTGLSVGTTDLPGENSELGTGYFRPTSEVRDLVNSDFVINIGNNFLETSLVQSDVFFDAQDAGAYVVTIDPHYSTMAQKSDEWIPIEPGTDAALYLGMISVIIEKGLYDEQFIRERTSMPFLVDIETGSLLTQGEPKKLNAKGKEVHAGDYVVWDENLGSVRRHDAEGVTPALKGTFTFEGKQYRPVFDILCESQTKTNAQWASERTQIPAEKIEELATRYATSSAAALCTGLGGNDKMTNSDIAGHSIAVLVALTGNIGKKGSFVGCFCRGGWGYMASLATWPMPEGMASITPKIPAYNLRYTENNVHAFIAYGDAMHLKYANFAETEKWIKSLDFVCAIDNCFTTVTNYADLILPITTKFESDERISGIKATNSHVLLREKAIDPCFESKTDFRLQLDIAELFGVSEGLPKSCEEWVRMRLESSKDETIKGVTLESLLENQCIQAQSCIDTYRRDYAHRFGTPSKKMEIYYEKMLPYDQQLPEYEECVEVYQNNPLREKYPLQFVQIRTKYRIHSQFYDAAWVNEFSGPRVDMNPIDLSSRGLNNEDKVRVYNDRGMLECTVVANPGVRPGCVRIIEGIWNKYMDAGGFQYLTNDYQVERQDVLLQGPVIPFNDTLVEVEKAKVSKHD